MAPGAAAGVGKTEVVEDIRVVPPVHASRRSSGRAPAGSPLSSINAASSDRTSPLAGYQRQLLAIDGTGIVETAVNASYAPQPAFSVLAFMEAFSIQQAQQGARFLPGWVISRHAARSAGPLVCWQDRPAAGRATAQVARRRPILSRLGLSSDRTALRSQTDPVGRFHKRAILLSLGPLNRNRGRSGSRSTNTVRWDTGGVIPRPAESTLWNSWRGLSADTSRVRWSRALLEAMFPGQSLRNTPAPWQICTRRCFTACFDYGCARAMLYQPVHDIQTPDGRKARLQELPASKRHSL